MLHSSSFGVSLTSGSKASNLFPRGNSLCHKLVRFWYIVANADSEIPANKEVKMKRFLVLLCAVTFIGGCSSTGGMNIISPSTPESEVKEKVSKAPLTKIQVVSENELKERRQETPSRDAAEKPLKTNTAAVADSSVAGAVPSIRSAQTLEALINLLEKKGTIQRDELLQEIKKLEEKDQTK